jgi:hypothetical protein
MMVTEKSPFVAEQLKKISEQVETIHSHYENKQQMHDPDKIPQEIQALISDLKSFNELLQDKKISRDLEVNRNIERLLNVLQIFPFSAIQYDKSIQEKVNALQVGLFSTFVKHLATLEINLKNFRIGRKVEGTNKGKSSSEQG